MLSVYYLVIYLANNYVKNILSCLEKEKEYNEKNNNYSDFRRSVSR